MARSEADIQRDVNRVLTLKQSIDTIRRQIESQNERQRKKQQKVQEEREQKKKDLISEGQNPYELWRREEMEALKERQRTALKLTTELRNEKLQEQLAVEAIGYEKKLENAEVKRREAEDFQKQMGNYAKGVKIASYIRNMTIGNVEVLDPTGVALRIDPSKVTIQKTWAFGLGRARAEEIDKVERDVKRVKARIAPKRTSGEEDELAEAEAAAAQAAAKMAQKLTEGEDQWESASARAGGGEQRRQEDEDGTGTLGSFEESSLDSLDGKLWVPKLTVLEQQYLAAARERQKQNITSVQRCWGKEFKGDAFLAKPSIIAFNDFEVGQRYRQVVEVTNVSLTFNQFKLLPLDDKIKDFFEINFVPPGRMSAGVTRYITIWFCPKVNTDIVSTFPILAKTGKIDFPLCCTTKKTILTVTPQDASANPIVDFGAVLSGESAQRTLQIKNAGALQAHYTIEPMQPEEDADFLQVIEYTPTKGYFGAFGHSKITFNFTPKALGTFSTELRLIVSNGAVGDSKFTSEWRIQVKGSCLDVPIYVEKEVYDLKTCVYGHTFRENVVVRNRQSVAMKIQVEKPKQIEGELQLNTTLAYIQGNKEQAIQVKFCPKDGFLDRHKEFRDGPVALGGFRIPFRIVGADQVLPVLTVLVGRLTTNFVSFEPSILYFGRCFVGSSVSCRLTVVNESLLKQKFAFMRLPSILSVQEVPSDVLDEEKVDRSGEGTAVLDGGGDGRFGGLLPGERRELIVTFSPEAATELDYKMMFKIITGDLCVRDFSVECRGQGVAPILSLSHAQVDLASIPVDTVSRESVVITNVSKVPQMMNIVVPPWEISALHADPLCYVLAPKESKRLQLEFRPNQEYKSYLPKIEEIPPPEPPAEDAEEGAEPVVDQEAIQRKEESEAQRAAALHTILHHGGRRWEAEDGSSVHCTWKIPIFMRPMRESGDASPTKSPTGGAGKQTVYLGVNTCLLPSIMVVEPAILDFGEVTAGQRKLLAITLTNNSGEPQELHMEALPENQCFTVLSAARTVHSKPFQLVIEFQPELVQIYQSILQLRTQSTKVQVPLRGRGVRPVLKIEPEDGVIKMGSVVFSPEGKDYTTATLEIMNESPFELNYKLDTLIRAEPNHRGVPPFKLSPASGTVAANGKMTVTVTFRPHRPLAVFREKILVNVPNQKEPTYVYLYGHCFKYQVYLLPFMDFGPFERDEVGKSAFVDSLAVGTGSGFNSQSSAQFEYPAAQEKQFSLVFEHGETVKYLLLGGGVPPGTPNVDKGAKETPMTYDVQLLPGDYTNLFTVEVPEGSKADKMAKGPLQSGKPALQAAFRYNPPANVNLSINGVDLDLLGGIGQWVTCQAKIILAGGAVPNGEPATQEIMVQLRAYLQQI